jgi:hypothetical protein
MTERNPIPDQILQGFPKEVILKDGTGVTLRPLRPGDEEALLGMFRCLPPDDLWFLDQDVGDGRRIAGGIDGLNERRMVSIVALLEERVVAHAVLSTKRSGAGSHIGEIRVLVAPPFRDRRLGTWMLLELTNLSIALGLRTLVMPLVRDRDAPIIHGVKGLDFQEEAVLKDFLLDREGHPHDLAIMIKRLPERWNDF